MSFITELKQRPEEERLAFAATVAISIIIILIILWIAIVFVRTRLVIEDPKANEQVASATMSIDNVVNKTGNIINSISEQYKELQGKTGSVGSQGLPVAAQAVFATSTIDEAIKNFMKIRYDEDGNMYIEDETQKSLLDELE